MKAQTAVVIVDVLHQSPTQRVEHIHQAVILVVGVGAAHEVGFGGNLILRFDQVTTCVIEVVDDLSSWISYRGDPAVAVAVETHALAAGVEDALIIEVDGLQKENKAVLEKCTAAEAEADLHHKNAVRYTQEKFVAVKNYHKEELAHEKTTAIKEGLLARLKNRGES